MLGALLATLGACSDPPTADARPSPPPIETNDYQEVTIVNGGSVAGRVRFTGDPPALPSLPVELHRERCGERQPSPALEVSARSGVAGAVVFLEGLREGRALEAPATAPRLRLVECRFEPRVLAVGLGWTIVLESGDPILHNAHARMSGRTFFDIGLPTEGSTRAHLADRVGVAEVLSDAGHPWMRGFVHVFDHPYFAVTDEEGRYRLTGVPPGQHVIKVWHQGFLVVGERAGRPRYSAPIVLARSATVLARQETAVSFEISHAAAEAAGVAD